MTYLPWFNHRRLGGAIVDGPGYTTPAAHEAANDCQEAPPSGGHPIARAVRSRGVSTFMPQIVQAFLVSAQRLGDPGEELAKLAMTE